MNTFIETKNLNKSFTTDAGELKVLKEIELTIHEKEMVGIIGASGVGKSTLLHILGALDRPTSGSVLYEGTDIFSLDRYALAPFRNKTVGFVFQFHHLLPEFTALENVMMPGMIHGIAVPKSNWAIRIDEPPFEAYQVGCGITFTFGGLRIAADSAQVLSTDLEPIPGLYAAGELVGGLFYFNYPGGTGLVSGGVFGRTAGNAAAAAIAGKAVA